MGKHYQLGDIDNVPQPINGSVPVMIGGKGERKTLRMVAQYADATNLFGRDNTEVLKHKLTVLKKQCDELDRAFDEIEKSTLSTFKVHDGTQSTDSLLKEAKILQN